MEKYEINENKKDIEKIFEYRYKLFIDVNRHLQVEIGKKLFLKEIY